MRFKLHSSKKNLKKLYFIIFNYFNMFMLKIILKNKKLYYFNIFIGKNHFESNFTTFLNTP
jgi:hypothetical protein